MRTHLIAPVIAASLVLLACDSGSADPPDAATPGEITYHQHIKPILDARCNQCHQPGGIAPFALTAYEQARAFAGVSQTAIEAGLMPPWQPDDDCADYVASRALEDEHEALFAAWIEGGMAEGDPTRPAPPIEVETTELSRVDLTVAMAESYLPQTSTSNHDDHRCFLVPWPEDRQVYVSGFRAVPGNASVVHHAVAFLATPDQASHYEELDASEPEPGYSCFGGTLGPAQEWLGAWAPGSLGNDLPPGLGIPVEPGSMIILQVHYNTLSAAIQGSIEPDLTSLQFKIDDEVERAARIMPFTSPQWAFSNNMPIPAHDADVTHAFAFDASYFPMAPGPSFDIYSAGLHMHLLGKRGRLSLERADGSSACLLAIDRWNFDWQDTYSLREPIRFERGDQIRIECNWDNSATNQPVIDGQVQPPRDVNWGEGSTDEMCLGVFLVAEP